MRTVSLFMIISGILIYSSCVTQKRFSDVQGKLNSVTQENRQLKAENIKLQTANTELQSRNSQLTEKNKDISSQLGKALYELNIEKQRNDDLENQQERLKREIDMIKKGSSSEIEMILKELQTARNDLIKREDRLDRKSVV